LTFLRDGQPLELTNSLMRGDRYQIQLKLERPASH
jgi:DNA-binding GntR family transcriptional regulator